jgi:predicted Zn-dependent peptidase
VQLRSKFQLDRPTIQQIGKFAFPALKVTHLENGIPVYWLEGGDQPVVKMEVVIKAGRIHERKRLAAVGCANLLKEGTARFQSLEIAEKIDHLGATLSFPFAFDYTVLQLYSINRHLPDLLPLLGDMIMQPVFPQHELELYQKRVVQRLSVDLAQNEIVAYRNSTELYFGSDHPYGYNSTPELYMALSQEDLLEHHQNWFGPERIAIFVAGRPSIHTEAQLQEAMGQWQHQCSPYTVRLPQNFPLPGRWETDLGHSQSALRIGRRLFHQLHPDYPGMLLLVTLLGGYFGSRLMKNIREDKGYTYGVHASLETLESDGYFSVSLETDKKHVDASITEVLQEMRVLQDQLVPASELQMVKSYLVGHVLSRMDGPLQALGMIRKNVLFTDVYDHTVRVLEALAKIDPEGLRSLARQYFNEADLTTVIVH